MTSRLGCRSLIFLISITQTTQSCLMSQNIQIKYQVHIKMVSLLLIPVGMRVSKIHSIAQTFYLITTVDVISMPR